ANAIKCKSDKPPKVNIRAELNEDAWTIYVEDNGIGIDMKHCEHIFTIFQRLHTKEEYPGTGIGLAIVKRIVERYGGKVGVRSKPGQGATFYFTVPED
ncbi:MAG: ATP-binding protein, partial [Candidatus Omnitrophica bacterium]|nr:ATP-binding protein [Candidatus Omnitrophota bacterium]